MLQNTAFVAWSCTIESGPIPELAEYSRSVDTQLADIRSRSTSTSNCGITKNGASASADKTIETIDRAYLEIPVMDNTFLDFRYNLQIAMNGETRSPVFRDGAMFNQIEKKITGAISSAANSCNLNDSAQEKFKSMLIANHALEDVFKSAALGIPTNPTGFSEKNLKIAEAISSGYLPTSTEGCKDLNGLEEGMSKIMEGIEKIWKKNDGVLTDWKKAIAMFKWNGSSGKSIGEKIDEKRKQLQSQLSNLGQSVRMSDRILSNYDCFTAESSKDDSVATAVKAKVKCMGNPILGLENILSPFKKKVTNAISIDERVYQVNNLSKENKVKTSVVAMDGLLRTRKSPEIETKSTIMLDLIDLHISLLFTAEAVEKRVPKMAKNCMKWQINVACPKP